MEVGDTRMLDKLSPVPEQLSHPIQDTLTALGCSFSERRVKERHHDIEVHLLVHQFETAHLL